MSQFINYNGQLLRHDLAIVQATNRGLRYGDGLFETMKLVNGKIELAAYHFERLFSGMKTLQFRIPEFLSAEYLSESIRTLAAKNNDDRLARIRLMMFRGNGGLYDLPDQVPQFIIETSSLNESILLFNEEGFTVDIYPDARKSTDLFSSLKTNNFLPYVMAALFAQSHNLHDALVLNTHGNICDSSIANIYIIKNGSIITPGLDSGCIAGVLRRKILEELPAQGFSIKEASVNLDDILHADEFFLSNSISCIRWVKQVRSANYTNLLTRQIYNVLLKELS
jgi:branched-chain amino acid aminotransferase